MSLLSMTDCSDAGNRVQARHELDAAFDDGAEYKLTVWAQKWGRALLEYADAAPTESDLDEAQGFQEELSDAETEIATLKTVIRQVISDLQDNI